MATENGCVRRLARRAWIGTLASALALFAASRAEAFDGACRFGVNAHQASNAALDLAAAAGIGWVRFDMNWFQFEPQKGQYDWTEADRFIDHAHALSLNVFVTIAYSPSWAVAQPCNEADPSDDNICRNRPPLNVADWTDFVSAAVSRYQDRVTHWGMWNEPNLKGFFNASRDQYVSQILIPGSAAVHGVCPSCQVLGPELAHLRGANWDANEGTCIGDNCAFNGWNYSLKMVLQAAASHIDVITHHKYAEPAGVFWPEAVDGEWIASIQIINGIKEVTDQYAPGKPVWITEFGMESEPYGSHTNAETAAQVTLFYQGMDAIQEGTFPTVTNQPWPELKKLFWYDLHDDPGGYSWGLLDQNLVPKPQYTAYADVIQQLGPCDGSGGSGGSGGSSSSSSGTGGATSSSGTGGSASSSGTGGASTSSGTGGSGATSSSSGHGDDGNDDGGCGCRLPGPSERPPSSWLILLGAAAWLRRRRG